MAFAAALSAAGSFNAVTEAAIKEWDGGTAGSSQTWTTTANWVGDVLPVTGDTLVFATRTNGDATHIIGSSTVGSLTGSLFTFSSATTPFFTAARPSLASLVFGNDTVSNLPATLSVFNNGTSSTVNQTMVLTGDADGNLFNVKNSVTSTIRLDRVNSGTLSLVLGGTGAAAGTGGINVANAAAIFEIETGMAGSAGIVKKGLGTLFLSTSTNSLQTYTGNVDIQGGILRIIGGGSLGATSNITNIGDGTLQIDSGGTVGADRAINLSSANSKISITGTGTTTISGALNGSGALNKVDTGSLYVGGASTYSGGTNVVAGVLRENGTHTNAGTYNVSAAGTYGGVGTVTLNSGAAVNVAGSLSPGASGSAIGTLTINGNVNLQSGGRLSIDADLGAVQKNDLLAVSGTLNLTDAALTVTGFPSVDGTPTIFATYGARVGTFTSTTIPSGYTLAYDYGAGANSIALLRGASSSLYFTGSQDSTLTTVNGSTSNFTNDAGGTTSTGAIPTAVTDLFFAATANTNSGNFNANLGATTLYANSLTFGTGQNASTPVTLTGTTLAIAGGAGSYGTGTGIRVEAPAGAVRLASAVNVGSSQTWTNNSSSPLTVTGTLATATNTLALEGPGGYVLNGAASGKIANNTTLTLNNSAAATVSAAISGTGNLILNGSTTLTLTGANTYTGTTSIVGPGSISVGSGGSFGTGEVMNESLITFINDSTPVVVSAVISGSGRIVKSGDSTVTFSGANTYTGNTTVTTGTMIIADGGRFGVGDSLVTNNATISFANTGLTTIANNIGGTGVLTQTGTGTTILNGQNTYGGITTVSAGTLALGDTGTFGSANIVDNGTVGFANNTAPLSVGNVISGTGGVNQLGAGTTRLTAANTYTGTSVVSNSSGTLIVNSTSSTPLLTGAGGADLQKGKIVFDYSGGTSPADTIRTLLTTSAAAGFLTGQIKSTTANANQGIGYIDNGVDSVTLRATLFGDNDLDGSVTINDFNTLAINFGKTTGQIWASGDYDYNNTVDINDFNKLAINFGKSLPVSGDYAGMMAPLLAFAIAHDDLTTFAALTGVPEPTSLSLIAAGAIVGLRRRRTAR